MAGKKEWLGKKIEFVKRGLKTMINPQLKEYVENNVLPQYENNDSGHGLEHIKYVIKRSLEFAKQVQDVELDMVYTVACYHDIGHYIDAKNHEKVSAELFKSDLNMTNFFNNEQINLIFEAIQDHRASGDLEPRSVYGKIVSSADRRTDMNNVMKTMYAYRLKHSPHFTIEENIEEAYQHMCRKFAKGGYATEKMYFKDVDYEKMLEQAEWYKNHKEDFVKTYSAINHLNVNQQ